LKKRSYPESEVRRQGGPNNRTRTPRGDAVREGKENNQRRTSEKNLPQKKDLQRKGKSRKTRRRESYCPFEYEPPVGEKERIGIRNKIYYEQEGNAPRERKAFDSVPSTRKNSRKKEKDAGQKKKTSCQ